MIKYKQRVALSLAQCPCIQQIFMKKMPKRMLSTLNLETQNWLTKSNHQSWAVSKTRVRVKEENYSDQEFSLRVQKVRVRHPTLESKNLHLCTSSSHIIYHLDHRSKSEICTTFYSSSANLSQTSSDHFGVEKGFVWVEIHQKNLGA